MSDPVVQIEGLTKTFKNNAAVNNVSFEVKAGDVFGLLGPNGAGKTTIIRMMLGLVKPSSGRAILFGQDVATHKNSILPKTSAIIESPALYPHLNGWENLRVMGQMVGVTDSSQIEWSLRRMNMIERADARFETYSLGMKQRMCIAAALLTDPELIILDEPTNGLDPAGIHDIRDLIKSLAEEGRTVFLSSHLLNEVQQVCNRVAIIQRGRIIAQGVVEEMLAARSFISFRVAPAEIEKAKELIGGLAWVKAIRQQGDNSLVVDGNIGQSAELNRVLSQAGIYVSELIPRNISLEEYFLQVTTQQPQTQVRPTVTKEAKNA